jgi:hypothetical protein
VVVARTTRLKAHGKNSTMASERILRGTTGQGILPPAVTPVTAPQAQGDAAMMSEGLCHTFVKLGCVYEACVAFAQTQTLQTMPPAKAQFADNNGVPALVLPVRPQLSSGITNSTFRTRQSRPRNSTS